jgi:hypothetical protein
MPDQLDQIKNLILSLPHVDLHGGKYIRFGEPVTIKPINTTYTVWAVCISETGAIEWMDDNEKWDDLHEGFHPDGAIAGAIINHLLAMQVSMSPTYLRNL